MLRVERQIEREVGVLMHQDDKVQDIVGGYSGSGDRCYMTGVKISGDLQHVKVFVAFATGNEAARRSIMKRLTGLTGCVPGGRTSRACVAAPLASLARSHQLLFRVPA